MAPIVFHLMRWRAKEYQNDSEYAIEYELYCKEPLSSLVYFLEVILCLWSEYHFKKAGCLQIVGGKGPLKGNPEKGYEWFHNPGTSLVCKSAPLICNKYVYDREQFNRLFHNNSDHGYLDFEWQVIKDVALAGSTQNVDSKRENRKTADQPVDAGHTNDNLNS